MQLRVAPLWSPPPPVPAAGRSPVELLRCRGRCSCCCCWCLWWRWARRALGHRITLTSSTRSRKSACPSQLNSATASVTMWPVCPTLWATRCRTMPSYNSRHLPLSSNMAAPTTFASSSAPSTCHSAQRKSTFPSGPADPCVSGSKTSASPCWRSSVSCGRRALTVRSSRRVTTRGQCAWRRPTLSRKMKWLGEGCAPSPPEQLSDPTSETVSTNGTHTNGITSSDTSNVRWNVIEICSSLLQRSILHRSGWPSGPACASCPQLWRYWPSPLTPPGSATPSGLSSFSLSATAFTASPTLSASSLDSQKSLATTTEKRVSWSWKAWRIQGVPWRSYCCISSGWPALSGGSSWRSRGS